MDKGSWPGGREEISNVAQPTSSYIDRILLSSVNSPDILSTVPVKYESLPVLSSGVP